MRMRAVPHYQHTALFHFVTSLASVDNCFCSNTASVVKETSMHVIAPSPYPVQTLVGTEHDFGHSSHWSGTPMLAFDRQGMTSYWCSIVT